MFAGEVWLSVLNLTLFLAMGHCVADFPLQTDRIATEKCPGCSGAINWRWWLTAHAGVHAFFVALITAVPLLALAEWVLHMCIDYGKCRRAYNMAVDQALHLACKLLWALLAVLAVPHLPA